MSITINYHYLRTFGYGIGHSFARIALNVRWPTHKKWLMAAWTRYALPTLWPYPVMEGKK